MITWQHFAEFLFYFLTFVSKCTEPEDSEVENNLCGITITLVAGGAVASEIGREAEVFDGPRVPSKAESLKALEQNLLV